VLSVQVRDVYEGELGKGKFVKKRVPKFFPSKQFIQANFLDMKVRHTRSCSAATRRRRRVLLAGVVH
jgi:hypothetical protein